MNKILKLTIVLLLVCAVVAGILGAVNQLTCEKIALQNKLKTERAYAAVLASEGYEDVGFDKEAFPIVDSVSKCVGGEGYVVTATFSGAQGKIKMAVGVDTDDKCTGISIISHSETSGLGAVAASASQQGVEFRQQFVGADSSVALSKSGGSIDAISGATITSTAVTGAVAEAIEAVAALEGGLGA